MPAQFIELLRNLHGDQAWAYQGERWLVVVCHGEDRPVHVLTTHTEAQAQAMVDRAAQMHAEDNNQCLVHYYTPAEVVGSVRRARDYGSNGSRGRARTRASSRREQMEMVILEGLDPNDRITMDARRASIWAEMEDDPRLYGRLKGAIV